MTIQFDYRVLDKYNALPHSSNERTQIFEIWCEISKLDRHVRKFDRTLKLYRFALDECRSHIAAAYELHNVIAKAGRDTLEGRELLAKCRILESDAAMYRSWTHTAARDGAMTIYHLCQGMVPLWSRMLCCSLLDPVKIAARKELADNHFEHAFPAFVMVRNSMTLLTHDAAATLHRDGGPIETGFFKSDAGLSLFFGGALEGDTFQVTHDNHIHGFDLYDDTLVALQQSIDIIRGSLVNDAK
jgi:hypothetical protein